MKKISVTAFVLIFTVLITAFPDVCAEILIDSFINTFTKVIPFVFPFLILSKLIMKSGIMKYFSAVNFLISRILGISKQAAEAFVLGNLCGFPIGASISAELYSDNRINKNEAYLIASYSNNVSTGFCIGYCGCVLLGSKKIGFVIYAVQFLSAIILCAALSKRNKSESNHITVKRSCESFPLTETISDAAFDSVKIIAVICFASLICCFFDNLSVHFALPQTISCLIKGIIEISGGCAESVLLSHPASLFTVTFFIGFSGLSVLMQSSVFLKGTDLSITKLLLYKLLQGTLSMLLLCLLYKFFNLGI